MIIYFLRKFIEAMLMPVGLSLVLTILGIAFRRRWVVLTSVVVLYTFSTPIVSTLLTYPLERVYPATTIAASPEADAIVVLSGSIVRGLSPAGVQWGDSANRYFTGYDLALAGKARLLVLSAGPSRYLGGSTQGEILRRDAVNRGLPSARIVVTGPVRTTEDEAQAVAQIPEIHTILLVTSAFHMPRSAMLFRARGFQVLPFPTDQRILSARWFAADSLVPDSGPLQGSEQAIREYAGLAIYRVLLLFRPGWLMGH
jgi:uncharacterized SAM-binding protein YcdF (DUF218 family)